MVGQKRDSNLQPIKITFSSVHCDNDSTAASATVFRTAQIQNKKHLKAVFVIMTCELNRTDVPIFRRISIQSPADQLLPHLLASLRESSLKGYRMELRRDFKNCFDWSGRSVAILKWLYAWQPPAKCISKSKTWRDFYDFAHSGESLEIHFILKQLLVYQNQQHMCIK